MFDMARESRTPYAILGCLTIAPMSGYDVKQFLERPISNFWSESYGQIYPALERLEDDGLVTGRDESRDGRERRVYAITEAGRERLRAWLERPAEAVTFRSEPTLKLFFGANAPLDATLRHVRRLRVEAEEALAHYREREPELEAKLGEDRHAPYWLAALRGGIATTQAILAWCDETEALLREHGGPSTSESEEQS